MRLRRITAGESNYYTLFEHIHIALLPIAITSRVSRIATTLFYTQSEFSRRIHIMDGSTPHSGSHYGRPPAYDYDDGSPQQLQGGSTMRLLTNVDEDQSYEQSYMP